MADWREALQDAMYPILTRLLQEGFVLPLFVTCIGRNGSMMCGRYDDIEATGLDFIVEASHLEDETFPLPIHMLVVDQRGEARHVRQEHRGRTGHLCLWSVTACIVACGRVRARWRLFSETFYWGDVPQLGGVSRKPAPADARAPAEGPLGGAVTRQATVRRAVCRRPPLLGSGPPTCGISTERRIG